MKVKCLFISDSITEYHYSLLQNAVSNNYYEGFNKPLFMKFHNYSDCVLISLNSFPQEFLFKNGIIKARRQFLQALKYVVESLEVQIVLFAASTKRLFGKEIELRVNWDGNLDDTGFTLRELYPEILFTNGDNGTAAILNFEIDSILQKTDIISQNNAVIINGLGLLGLDTLEYLLENNLKDDQIIIISNHTKDLKELVQNRQINVFSSIPDIEIDEIDRIRAIVNCTHNPTSLITAENLKCIQNGQSIHVIDVAVPYGFPEEEFIKCKNVYRQDGGNAYVENGLEFFFNPEICGLTENVLYGCFAETIALSSYLKENPEEIEFVRNLDLFNVNTKTKNFVKGLFEKYGIGISPVPYSFNKKIE